MGPGGSEQELFIKNNDLVLSVAPLVAGLSQSGPRRSLSVFLNFVQRQ